MLRTTLCSTKYKSSSDSEEQMNVVHLNIVINIAYGKFSMKVYDIIVEGEGNIPGTIAKIGRKVLGMSRSFETAAAKKIFDSSVQDLADEMYRIETSLGRTATDLDINRILKNTLYTEDSAKVFANPKSPDYLTPAQIKELRQDAIDEAKKILKTRLKDNNKTGSTKPGLANRIVDKITLNGVVNSLTASGIFYATAWAEGGPVNDYFVRRQMASHKLELGPDRQDTKYPEWNNGKGFTQEQYNTYLAEEQFVMVANLVPYMIPFSGLLGKILMGAAAGTSIAYPGPGEKPTATGVSNTAIGGATGAAVGVAGSIGGWVMSSLTPVGWNVTNKSLAGVWTAYLMSDPKVPYTGFVFNRTEDLTLRQTLTTLALSDGLAIPRNVVSKVEMGLDGIADAANKLVIDWAKKKGIPTTLDDIKQKIPFVGKDKPESIPYPPPTEPAGTTQTSSPSTPTGKLPDVPTVFHPNEWKKQNGSWQYRGTSKHTLTNYEYSQLKDGDPIPLD